MTTLLARGHNADQARNEGCQRLDDIHTVIPQTVVISHVSPSRHQVIKEERSFKLQKDYTDRDYNVSDRRRAQKQSLDS